MIQNWQIKAHRLHDLPLGIVTTQACPDFPVSDQLVFAWKKSTGHRLAVFRNDHFL
jgi:hypothetical protein